MAEPLRVFDPFTGELRILDPVEETPNFNLIKPPKGFPDWHESINDNSDTIDAALQGITEDINEIRLELGTFTDDGHSKVISVPITTSSITSTAAIPSGAVVLSAHIDITQAYNSGVTIEIGLNADVDALQTSEDNDPEIIGLYKKNTPVSVTLNSVVSATITGASQGVGLILVEYVVPLL